MLFVSQDCSLSRKCYFNLVLLDNMKFETFCLFIFLVCLEASSTVKVSVYYETLCPDSIAFIKNQLHPNYEVFGEKFIQLELIPYGHAEENNVNGTDSFTCQHGPKECYGNKVHGCVLNSETIGTSEKFINCSESADPPTSTENLKQCADENNIAWSKIQECISSGQADDIMRKNGKQTNAINPQWIPTIVFNEIFNETDSEQSQNDFKGVVCKYLDNKPDACHNSKDDSSTVKLSVYYETLCPDSVAFINNQLHPNYKAFGEKFIQLELIPYGFAKEKDINGTDGFTCQHGPKECYGNKVHGCVLNSESISTSEHFIYCSESANPPTSTENLKQCADQNNIAWSKIEECISSGQADNIMRKNGNRTNELSPEWIPTIVFNDIFNDSDSQQSQNDLKGVVCKYLDNKPDECHNFNDIRAILV